MPRPTPFHLVFEQIAEDNFPQIRAALAASGHDPTDRDAFLMLREAVDLLRELRPEQGIGEGMEQLVALVHHAYLTWDAGALTTEISPERTAELLDESAPPAPGLAEPPSAYYAQLPERRIWAEVIEGEPPEPLDGCFVHAVVRTGELRVLGIFGVRPERSGFTAVEAAGPRLERLARLDGTRPFSPSLPGGAAARLYSLVGAEELLELGWRTRLVAVEAAAEAA
ncbi:MAG: hypothetical protein ACREMX_00895 [Gemmatimonadales bacterium]